MHLTTPLTVREHMALQVAGATYRHEGSRHSDVSDLLGWSPTRHAQVVTALLRRPEALAAYPVLVRRLLRLQDMRRRQRRGAA